MEEAGTTLALESHAERVLKSRPHCGQGRRVACRLDPREPIAGIGCEKPCQIPWLGERRPMRQGSAQILAQAGTYVAGEGSRLLQPSIELRVGGGHAERFERFLPTRRVRAEEREFA